MSNGHSIPVSAPVDTDSAGRGGEQAIQSVFRVICRDTNSSGTCFLHISGNLITAEHVIRGSKNPEIVLSNGNLIASSVTASNLDLDLAVLKPVTSINGQALKISSQTDFAIGTQVSTWGFPGGYGGSIPMLSVGYLSAMTGFKTNSGKVIKQWVVNAAFNSGNSGGPLLHVETGDVIGIVSSKLAPLSPSTKIALEALASNTSGFMYTSTAPDGTITNYSEGQVIAAVLNDLRQQIQLVIGMAVLLSDLRDYLNANKITP
jgi:serine protease Do